MAVAQYTPSNPQHLRNLSVLKKLKRENESLRNQLSRYQSKYGDLQSNNDIDDIDYNIIDEIVNNETIIKHVECRKDFQYPPGLVNDYKETGETINTSNMELSVEHGEFSSVFKQIQNHYDVNEIGINKQDQIPYLPSLTKEASADEIVESELDDQLISILVSDAIQDLNEYQTDQPEQEEKEMSTLEMEEKQSLNPDADEFIINLKSSTANRPKLKTKVDAKFSLNVDAVEFYPNSHSPPQQIDGASFPLAVIKDDHESKAQLNIAKTAEIKPKPPKFMANKPRLRMKINGKSSLNADKKSDHKSKAQKLGDNVIQTYKRDVHISWDFTGLTAKTIKEKIAKKPLFDFICLSLRLEKPTACTHGDVKIFDFDFHNKNGQKLYCMAEKPKDKKEGKKYHEWTMKKALYTQQEIQDINPYYRIPQSIRGTFDDLKEQQREISDQLTADKIISKTKWCQIPIKSEFNGKLENKCRWTLSLNKGKFMEQLRKNEDFMNMKDIDLIPIIAFHGDHKFHIEYVQILTIAEGVDIAISYKKDKKCGVYVAGIYTNKEELRNLHYLISPRHIARCKCFDKFTTTINHLAIGNPDDPQNQVKALRNSIKQFQLKCAVMERQIKKISKQNGTDNRDHSSSHFPQNKYN